MALRRANHNCWCGAATIQWNGLRNEKIANVSIVLFENILANQIFSFLKEVNVCCKCISSSSGIGFVDGTRKCAYLRIMCLSLHHA